MKVAISWNALHRFTWLYLLACWPRRPKGSLSGKSLVVLGFKAEKVINVHLLIVYDS